MPPRKTSRSTKKAPPPAPEEIEAALPSPAADSTAPQPTDDVADEQRQQEEIEQEEQEEKQQDEQDDEDDSAKASSSGAAAGGAGAAGAGLEDRMAKLKQLRQRMVRFTPSSCHFSFSPNPLPSFSNLPSLPLQPRRTTPPAPTAKTSSPK